MSHLTHKISPSKKKVLLCIGCRMRTAFSRDCKRCGVSAYKSQNGEHAIAGLHSSWVHTNILACARLNQDTLETVIKDFIDHNIRAVFNLTQAGEHPYCGHELLEDSGFSYRPEHLMAYGIRHFNWNWPDMTAPHLNILLDIVTIALHEIRAGHGIALHCHAGFGRTGTAIACILIAYMGFSAHEAIQYTRKKRRGSIQKQSQEAVIKHFETYYTYLRSVFPDVDDDQMMKDAKDKQIDENENRQMECMSLLEHMSISPQHFSSKKIRFHTDLEMDTTNQKSIQKSGYQDNPNEDGCSVNCGEYYFYGTCRHSVTEMEKKDHNDSDTKEKEKETMSAGKPGRILAPKRDLDSNAPNTTPSPPTTSRRTDIDIDPTFSTPTKAGSVTSFTPVKSPSPMKTSHVKSRHDRHDENKNDLFDLHKYDVQSMVTSARNGCFFHTMTEIDHYSENKFKYIPKVVKLAMENVLKALETYKRKQHMSSKTEGGINFIQYVVVLLTHLRCSSTAVEDTSYTNKSIAHVHIDPAIVTMLTHENDLKGYQENHVRRDILERKCKVNRDYWVDYDQTTTFHNTGDTNDDSLIVVDDYKMLLRKLVVEQALMKDWLLSRSDNIFDTIMITSSQEHGEARVKSYYCSILENLVESESESQGGESTACLSYTTFITDCLTSPVCLDHITDKLVTYLPKVKLYLLHYLLSVYRKIIYAQLDDDDLSSKVFNPDSKDHKNDESGGIYGPKELAIRILNHKNCTILLFTLVEMLIKVQSSNGDHIGTYEGTFHNVMILYDEKEMEAWRMDSLAILTNTRMGKDREDENQKNIEAVEHGSDLGYISHLTLFSSTASLLLHLMVHGWNIEVSRYGAFLLSPEKKRRLQMTPLVTEERNA